MISDVISLAVTPVEGVSPGHTRKDNLIPPTRLKPEHPGTANLIPPTRLKPEHPGTANATILMQYFGWDLFGDKITFLEDLALWRDQ